MQVNYDITGLDRQEVNLIHSTLSAILAQRGITHGGITCTDGVCTVANPSGAFNVTLAQILAFQQAEPNMAASINQNKAARNIAAGLTALVILLAPFSSAVAMTRPVFVGAGGLNTAANRYVQWDTGASNNIQGSDGVVAGPIAVDGTIANLYARLTVAPGAGKSVAFTLYQNGSSTAVTCTISDAATSCSDTTHSATIFAGDNVSVEIVPTGTPAGSSYTISASFAGTASGEVAIGGGASGMSNTAINYATVPGNSSGITNVATTSNIVPTQGTIDRLYLRTSGEPGVGKSWTLTLFVNGSSSAITTTCSNTTQQCTDLSNSITVYPEDTISFQTSPSGSPAGNLLRWSFRWRPLVDGETPIFTRTTGSSQFVTVYEYPNTGGTGIVTTESTTQFSAPVDFAIRKLYTSIDVVPGVGDSRAVYARINGVNGTLFATTTAAALTANNTVSSDSITAGQLFNWSRALSGSPSAFNNAFTSAVAFIDPGGAPPPAATGDPGLIWFFGDE